MDLTDLMQRLRVKWSGVPRNPDGDEAVALIETLIAERDSARRIAETAMDACNDAARVGYETAVADHDARMVQQHSKPPVDEAVEALEEILLLNQERYWTATEDNPETHWEVRDGQYAKIARTALANARSEPRS